MNIKSLSEILIINKYNKLWFIAMSTMLMISTSYADPKVYSPHVTKGETAIGYRGNTTLDDDDDNDGTQRHVFLIEHGVTDWWKTEIVSRLNEAARGSLRYDSTAWENIFQLTEKGKYWLDAGLYIEYKLKDENNAPDIFEGKLLLEKNVADFVNTLNLTIEQEVGDHGDDDLEFQYAWRTRKEFREHMKLGIEAFGAMGELRDIKTMDEQSHIIGPVFYHEIKTGESNEFEYNIGWLFGLTEASPDNTFRWQMEYKF